MAKPTHYFQTACEFIGWGDPKNALWFIGLEEAKTVEDDAVSYLEALRENKFVPELLGNWKELGASGRGIRDYTSKIAQPLSRKYCDSTWRDYRDELLWREGSRIFQSNLYPLGKPNLRDWPSHYKSLFGFSQDDRSEYKAAVRETRFPLIREFRNESQPQATICFGNAGWDDFELLLELNPKNANQGDERIKTYQQERVMLVPFLGQGFSSDLAIEVAQKLRDWKVKLP